MDHLLFNPNQIHHYDIPDSDNLHDSGRSLGINHGELIVPFRTQGSTVFFESHMPSDDKLEWCPHIVLMCDKIEWDPIGVAITFNRP